MISDFGYRIYAEIIHPKSKIKNMLPSQRIKELGLEFPPAPKPAGVYRPILVVDNFL